MKLVTIIRGCFYRLYAILIHTSVKLVTATLGLIEKDVAILIHTSVKLVTHLFQRCTFLH